MRLLSIMTALKFALRESRSVFQYFKVFILSLFMGTAIIAGVGSVSTNISESLKQDGRILLGGDLDISLIQERLNHEEKEYLTRQAILSEVATLRSMAHVGQDSSLVDLKAVDRLYPLYGEFQIVNNDYTSDTLAKKDGIWGIIISEALATRLKISVGASIKLGTENYQVRGIIEREPDSANQGFQLAPGAIIALDSLFENSLVQPGSLVRYQNRIKLNENVDLTAYKNNLEKKYPDRGWQVRDSSSGGSGLKRFVSTMGQFMTLVGLSALLIGGVGVSNAVHSYLDEKTDTIATYKVLGARGQTILIIYLGQIMFIACMAILFGVLIGAILPLVTSELLKDNLPVNFTIMFYAKPLVLAVFYSIVITLIFTLWPLGKAVQVPSARLFRQTVTIKRNVKQSLPYILTITALTLLLLGVVIFESDFRMVTALTLAAAVLIFLVLFGLSALIKKITKSLPRPRNPRFRIAFSNIYRPGNSTTSIVLSLGLGLILFTTIALIENNMLREINDRVSGEAPSFFFIDIQKSQHDDFIDYLNNRKGVETYRLVPNLRGRITHVKSVEADKVMVKPGGEWILRGDRGVTFTSDLPKDNKIIAGKWWADNYNGPSAVSISQQMAESMDLKIGDDITLNILSRDFKLPIASIRSFEWESFGINYVMMLDPQTLKSAPYNYVATAKATLKEEAKIYQELNQKFPSISIIRMKEVMSNVIELLKKIAGAIDVMALITIISGVIVLAGAIAAGHRSRIYDAAILKVLGATRRDILAAYVIEFILLGVLTGLIAIILGSLAAFGVITFIMKMSWNYPFVIPVGTVMSSATVTLLFGMVSIWIAMSARPAQVLRKY